MLYQSNLSFQPLKRYGFTKNIIWMIIYVYILVKRFSTWSIRNLGVYERFSVVKKNRFFKLFVYVIYILIHTQIYMTPKLAFNY